VPELPDITIYLEALERRIVGQTLNRVRVASPFLLRTAVPPLTDPNLFSGIGNAYSDEILYAAQLSPVALTQRLLPTEIERLHRATLATLQRWIELLRQETGDAFPEKVTAFRPQMAVHGKFGQPCPTCGAKVQRIRYADNETNYCPGCQTGGKLLADRSLSMLLKKDWPKTPEELEELRTTARHQRTSVPKSGSST
jgi:formamidopyrimidine-DNA glycosylase